MELNLLKNEDCLVTLASMEDNSIDAIVTDPPYELGYMKKAWDKTGIAFNVELWKECFRVLKPGGHLLAFGGTRTIHRMTVAIEDAGFDVTDMIMLVYSSGFPKRGLLSKEYDKLMGNEREVLGVSKKTQPDFQDQQYIDQGSMMLSEQAPKRKKITVTKGTSELEGLSTTLKPAVEPIIVARKEISEQNVLQNVLKWGTGALNVDECRIPLDDGEVLHKTHNGITSTKEYYEENDHKDWTMSKYFKNDYVNTKGRWPANFIHDGSEEVESLFPITKASKPHDGDGKSIDTQNRGFGFKRTASLISDNGGSAARFFYSTKTTTEERNYGLNLAEQMLHSIESDPTDLKKKNFHPTVKPVKLMEYLVKLVTPKNGIVYDPFAGSGSTLVACKLTHRKFIGSEMIRDYYKIALKRIRSAFVGFDLED